MESDEQQARAKVGDNIVVQRTPAGHEGSNDPKLYANKLYCLRSLFLNSNN